jgi:dienelactone hydrolase
MLTGTMDKIPNLQTAKLLMLYGDRDIRVPKSLIDETVSDIRETHKGKEGCDWKYSILPDAKHGLNDTFISETMEWTKKWMLANLTTSEAKMVARL